MPWRQTHDASISQGSTGYSSQSSIALLIVARIWHACGGWHWRGTIHPVSQAPSCQCPMSFLDDARRIITELGRLEGTAAAAKNSINLHDIRKCWNKDGWTRSLN